MKSRVTIPSSEMHPLPGESPADAIRRAVVGRPSRKLVFESGKDDKDSPSSSRRSR